MIVRSVHDAIEEDQRRHWASHADSKRMGSMKEVGTEDIVHDDT